MLYFQHTAEPAPILSLAPTLAFALQTVNDLDDYWDVVRAVIAARLCCRDVLDDLDEAIQCERDRREIEGRL